MRKIRLAAVMLSLCLFWASCEQTPGVKLTTFSPSNITSTSADCGAGLELTKNIAYAELGVCWSKSSSPTIDDYSSCTSEIHAPFYCKITHLQPQTKYYVRAYLLDLSTYTVYYGKTKSFTTTSGGSSAPIEGSLKGKFSVAMGEQVYFSKGNLQYHPMQDQWRFAEHQWDIVGKENNYTSATYNGWMDLFGWRTSGYNNIYPYTTATQTQFYGPLTANMAGTNYDWGVYNAISNGGNQRGLWRTLEDAELKYLLAERQTASGCRYAKAIVNNVHGLIVLPDDWSISYYQLNHVNETGNNFTDDCSYATNVISLSDWTNSLESHGAVFLPAAGMRIGTNTEYYSDGAAAGYGRYWTSTWYGSDRAVALEFSNSGINWNHFPYFNQGYSVRLVRNVD